MINNVQPSIAFVIMYHKTEHWQNIHCGGRKIIRFEMLLYMELVLPTENIRCVCDYTHNVHESIHLYVYTAGLYILYVDEVIRVWQKRNNG